MNMWKRVSWLNEHELFVNSHLKTAWQRMQAILLFLSKQNSVFLKTDHFLIQESQSCHYRLISDRQIIYMYTNNSKQDLPSFVSFFSEQLTCRLSPQENNDNSDNLNIDNSIQSCLKSTFIWDNIRANGFSSKYFTRSNSIYLLFSAF